MGEPIFEKRFLDRERAKELYDQGWCDQQIADECGVTRETVKAWRRKSGLIAHTTLARIERKRPPCPDLVVVAAEAKAHGMSYGQYVAAKYGGLL